jgi:hypothetical protein
MLMIAGEILDGVVRVGDRASGLGGDFPVAAVEMLTRSDRSCDVALGVRYADDDDLARLRRSATAGMELRLSSGDST